jgi:urease accessory protein
MRHPIASRLLTACALAVVATEALAHPQAGSTAVFSQGLLHPLLGMDHILAMLAVGMWAAQLGGRALWGVPLAFVAMMAAGGMAGVAGLPVPMVELGIAGSVLVFGLLILFGARMPLAISMGLVGMFALFHGHAHGSEMPATVSGLSYGVGFLLATALLHGAGIAAGRLARRPETGRLLRAGGAAIAGAGVYLLAGL